MSKISLTRRTFIKASGLATAMPALASSRAIRTAFYGIAHGHFPGKLRTIQEMDEFQLVGICEPNQSVMDKHSTLSAVPFLTESELLHSTEIDLIVVESDVPDLLRYAHRSVEAGKWVHMDKPPGDDIERFEQMIGQATSNNRMVQMGYKWRYHPAMSTAIRLAREGWLGAVYMVRSTLNKPLSVKQRLAMARYQGGIMFIEGCHMLDRTLDLLGKPQDVRSWIRHDGITQDGLADNNLAVLTYKEALAEIYIAALQPNGNSYRTFEILGSNGTATVRPYFPAPYKVYVDLKEAAGPYRTGQQVLELENPPGPPFVGDFTDLAKIIRGQMAPNYTADFDLMTHRTLLEICKVGI